MAVQSRPLDVRWLRRYRFFWTAGLLILAGQALLFYVFVSFDPGREGSASDILSGKGRLNVEVDDHIIRLRNYASDDDDDEDDSIGNSNSIYSKNKPKVGLKHSSQKTSKDANKTVSLRLEELDFTPVCEIRSKDAVYAVHRARTQNCKQLIVNTTCLIASGELYPRSLPHSCPAPGMVKGRSLGCYQDDKTRLLKEYYINLRATSSPERCINLCLQSGFPYAGVEYGGECYCGVAEPPSSAKLPDSSCNMKCPADPKQACGGYYTINVYQTGISRLLNEPVVETWAKTPRSKDSRVRIVYLLTLNGRAVRQVKRLIKALFHSSHFFYIHVDARQDYLMRELLQLEIRHSNIRLCRRRHATIWGGASLLTMLLEAMSDLVQSAWQWDFFVNLSESDYPVKTNDQLVDFLTANRERNFVKSHGREIQRFIQKQGLDKTFIECDAHMWRTGDRVLPSGIVIDGGSDWLALSRPFVEYVSSASSEPLLQGLIALFKHTLLPAESFFHTALRNSVYCSSYVDNNLHVTNWKRKLGCKCQYKHIVDWCGCSPNNFKIEDWPRLQATEGKPVFFARKFEPIVDLSVINKLDAWLYGPPPDTEGLDSHWQSVYNIKDLGPTEDALVAVGRSLARFFIKNSNCSTALNELLEITTYRKSDVYEGSLVLFDVLLSTVKSQIEIRVKPLDTFEVRGNAQPSLRIKRVFVSTDFDPKEQISRNHLRVIGPFSEPCLVFEMSPIGAQYNATALWLDPALNVVSATDFLMEENSHVGFVKAGLKTPLLPGTWTVHLVYNSTVFCTTLFLVTPLESISGNPLTLNQAQFMHYGPGQVYNKLNLNWSEIVKTPDRSFHERIALSNSKRIGKDLTMWIDSLTSKFYKVEDSCATTFDPCKRPICRQTPWSSMSPDPKTELKTIDKSGRITR